MTLIHEPPSGIPIAEAAEISGVSTHTLRYYERAGLMLTPVDRASSSHRRYSPADLSWVAFLTRLRMTGMPIAGIRRYTDLVREGASTIAERRELLVAHRERVREELADITASLRAIDDKIDIYDKEIS